MSCHLITHTPILFDVTHRNIRTQLSLWKVEIVWKLSIWNWPNKIPNEKKNSADFDVFWVQYNKKSINHNWITTASWHFFTHTHRHTAWPILHFGWLIERMRMKTSIQNKSSQKCNIIFDSFRVVFSRCMIRMVKPRFLCSDLANFFFEMHFWMNFFLWIALAIGNRFFILTENVSGKIDVKNL